jgi:ankyrin repeat protein
MRETEFVDAVRRGDPAAVASLLDVEPELVHAEAGGTTPLLLAIYHGHSETASPLVARNASLTFAEACAAGLRDRVSAWLDRDASVIDQLSPDGFTPVGLAIFFRHDDLARDLIERGADFRAHARNQANVAPIHAAVSQGNAGMVRLLLDRGVDPNDPQQAGVTPLHGAAAGGHRELAELLLGRGASRDARTNDGKTAADLAAERGHPDLAAWLVWCLTNTGSFAAPERSHLRRWRSSTMNPASPASRRLASGLSSAQQPTRYSRDTTLGGSGN